MKRLLHLFLLISIDLCGQIPQTLSCQGSPVNSSEAKLSSTIADGLTFNFFISQTGGAKVESHTLTDAKLVDISPRNIKNQVESSTSNSFEIKPKMPLMIGLIGIAALGGAAAVLKGTKSSKIDHAFPEFSSIGFPNK